MKKILALLGLGLLAGAAALPALATPITITTPGAYQGDDVGSIDTLYGYGKANSGDQSEVDFANYLTGQNYQVSDFAKFCDGSEVCGNMLLNTSEAGVFAIYLASAPEFFMIKTGAQSSFSQTGTYACTAGSPGGDDCEHFLFENLGNTSFLVFRMTDMGFGADATGKISHVDSFGTTTVSVPEPGILGMFGAGIGLIGLFLALRRRAC